MAIHGMTTEQVPVPIRVRHVTAGDVFMSARDGSHWLVSLADDQMWRVYGREIVAICDGRTVTTGPDARNALDPDHVLDVLVPADEASAVELCREELGARLIAGRTV
jgi:hypothetical protein